MICLDNLGTFHVRLGLILKELESLLLRVSNVDPSQRVFHNDSVLNRVVILRQIVDVPLLDLNRIAQKFDQIGRLINRYLKGLELLQ